MEETKPGHTIELSDRFFKLITALIVVLAVFLAGQLLYQFKNLPENFPREITVSGEGKAYVKPDIALINFGVTSEAPKSQDAVSENNQKMNAVIQSIKDLGVEQKDIKTTSYNLYPVYGYQKVQPLYHPADTNKITGYRLEQQVQVKIRNFDKINEIIDQVTSAGANVVGSLQFTVDDPEKVKAEARVKAIEQAKEKAEVIVKQAGLKVDKLVNISEGYYGPPIPYGAGYAGAALKEDSSVPPQIEPGQTEVSVSITLTYRIR